MIRFYNSLGRKLDDFEPMQAGKVSLYTCGPTVYDYPHIGNLRKYIFDDTLRRFLVSQDLSVTHVMNVTDVGHLVSDADEGQDKLEKGAQQSGKSVWEVADYYLDAFQADIEAMNILQPTQLIRATAAIDNQINMVERLIAKGFAYQTEEAIYFDVTKLPDYGRLSGQRLTDKQVGVRDAVVTETSKRNPQDFAVWFFTVGHFADHQMRWPSPWGEGFPGWHLECSAIIEQSLGETIDIHTGGIDNLGTHHVNEMAQSEAVHNGAPLAHTWMHVLHLHVDGTKMSKSLGNFYTLKQLSEKGYHPLAFRLMMLQAHYRSELNFTIQGLEAAQNRLLDLYNWACLQFDERSGNDTYDPKKLDSHMNAINDALAGDLATPMALSILSEMVDDVQAVPSLHHEHFRSVLKRLDDLFGLRLAERQDISDQQKQLISNRNAAKQQGDYGRADALRNELLKDGLTLRDTQTGTMWGKTAL